MAWVWFPFFWNVEHFYVTLVPSETPLIRTWGWKWQVNMKNINASLKVGEKLKEHHIVKSASMFITSLCLWKRVLLLFEWNFSWGSLLSKLMWHGFSHFPEIVTWGLFLHTAYEAKCKKKVKAALVLSSYAYVHRERNSGERVREGQDPSLPQLASCKLDLQMVPCGSSMEESSKGKKGDGSAKNICNNKIFKKTISLIWCVFFLWYKQ